MKIDKDIFYRLADMAKIEISKNEEKQLIDDLNTAIEFIETMNEADTENTEPFSFISKAGNALREDIVTENSAINRLIANAPDFSDGFYVVPKTLD
ncbi:MAG TPA: Asp-tRNA(Asn)/Glu-tRNA(Gln) amidotransferase subunit GatC [Mobilitalea sp.]|nr:Asp-tRNA(Asn)/Glu-tRNA(Gln) amidotransferase subunit GatC [Mobilitalea sp.]